MIKLMYWAKRGRGEQVRLLLQELDQPYEDVHVVGGSPEFVALQKSGPKGGLAFASIPMIEDGDLKLVQGPAILGYLARKHGMLPADDLADLARADAIALGAEDLRMGYFGLFGPGAAAKQRAFVNGRFTERWLPAFDGLLELGGDTGFFVGGRISHADIAVWDALDAMAEWVEGAPEAIARFPRVQAHRDAIASRPRIAAYLTSDRRVDG